MIHGAPGAWYGYLKQMDDSILNQHFTMLAPDRLGYGHSDQGFSVPSIAAQSEVIAEMIRKEKQGRKVILMGRSFGSPIASYIAATYPECADALVLVSSAADPQAEKYFKAGKLADPGCLLHGCVPTAMRVANDEKHIHAAELKKILYIWQHIRQPVEILQATDDQIVYYRNAVFLDSALVNAPHHLIKIKQGGHLITYQHPELVRETLLRLKSKL
jgi:pimeloyl-ACP methyl ester carboxylesterase